MPATKILKCCSICQRLGAGYLVIDEQLGRMLLCYACWKVRAEAQLACREQAEPPADPDRLESIQLPDS